MRKLIIFISVILILVGCESKLSVIFDNRTSYNLYYTIDQMPFIIMSNEARKHTFNAGTYFIFNDTEKTILVTAIGETYEIDGEPKIRFVTLDSSNSSNPRKLIFYANRAGLKVINASHDVIDQVRYRKVNIESSTVTSSGNLLHNNLNPGEEFWCVLEYNMKDTIDFLPLFYYIFEISTKTEGIRIIEDNIYLRRDEQYLINFQGSEIFTDIYMNR